MGSYTGWTPASRPGIVPLHPLSFGTLLGRSFTALRQNPRVLLGFALVVQTAAYLVTIVGIGAVTFWAFSRLDTVPFGSEDFDTLFQGSTLIVIVTAFLLGLPAAAVVVLVQGVVVAEVSAEVLAEKLTLGAVWRRTKPAVWRLLGWAALVAVAVGVVIAVVVAVLIGIGIALPPLAVVLGIVLFLGAIPLWVWLSTKLVLVPAVLILERATIGAAVRRSWHLTRRRFWVTFGVMIIISSVFGAIAQAVSLPLTFGASFVTTIFAPTGDPDVTEALGLILTTVGVQCLVLLVQSVGAIVQSTAVALLYVDGRMRHEGLDLDLQAYVERRDAGATGLPDPYLAHIGREVAPRPTPGSYGVGYAAGGYGAGGYGGAGYPPAGYPQPPGYPPNPPPAGYPPPAASAPPPVPAPPAPESTAWAAPGAASDADERETPWR